MTGTIVGIEDHGTIIMVTIQGDDGRTYSAAGHHRMTRSAIQNLFPEGVKMNESRVDFDIESWGGLAYLSEATEGA